MTRPTRKLRRALEDELRRLPAPPPPAGLLDRIRADIPATLAAAPAAAEPARDAPRGAWHRRPAFRLAAALAVAALAGTVAWQTMKARESTVPSRSAKSAEVERAAPSQQQEQSLERPAVRAAEPPAHLRQGEAPPPPARMLEKRAIPDAVVPPSPESFSVKGRDRRLSSREQESDALAVGKSKGEATPEPVRVPVDDALVELPDSAAPPAPAAAAPAAPKKLSEEEFLRRNEAYTDSYVDEETKKQRDKHPETVLFGGHSSTASSVASKDIAVIQDGRAEAGRREATQPDTMIFRPTGEHRFVRTEDDALSTFALDVDTGSFDLARAYLERGTMPPPEAIRVEEFVNAMSYRDPAPRGEDFALVAQGAASPYPDAPGLELLRFAVKAREVARGARKPANLTFVVDVSGSMDRENRLGLVKRALGLLLDALDERDRVALVVYGSTGRILLHPTRDLGAIRAAIARLVPEGSTNAEQGLRLGYDLADEAWERGEINRVILCSDGVANVGATGPESILARIGEEARRGIQLTTVGFGMGNYNDALMEQLADQGDGTYHYVDDLDAARKIFVQNLTGTLQNVARDAKVQVEFDPETVDRWRLLGYENRAVADRDFRNDRIDAGEVGAGQSASALYEVRLREGVRGRDRIATLKLRWKSVDGREVRELHRDLAVSDLERNLARSGRDLRVASVAGLFAEKLKQTRAGRELSWRELAAMAAELAEASPRDADARALADFTARAARLAEDATEGRRGNPERLDEE